MTNLQELGRVLDSDIKEDLGLLKTVRLTKAGEFLVSKIKEGYKAQLMGGPPLAAETVKRKGSSEKLIDTGRMVNSFKFVIQDGRLYVGSDYKADELGIPLCQLHENGVPSKHGGWKTPPRPMLRLIWERESGKLDEIMAGTETKA